MRIVLIAIKEFLKWLIYNKSVILSKSNAEINKTAPFIGTAVQITCAGGRIKWHKMFSLNSIDKDFYDYT